MKGKINQIEAILMIFLVASLAYAAPAFTSETLNSTNETDPEITNDTWLESNLTLPVAEPNVSDNSTNFSQNPNETNPSEPDPILSAESSNETGSTVEYNAETKTVFIRENGSVTNELQLIEANPDLTRFSAVFRFRVYSTLDTKERYDYFWNVRNFGATGRLSGFGVKELYNATKTLANKTCSSAVFGNETVETCADTRYNITYEDSRWIPMDFTSYIFQPDIDHFISVNAERAPKTGFVSSDVSPTIAGHDLMPYFVWWNTSYVNCKNLTITERAGYSGMQNMIINLSGLAIKSDGSDIRIVNQSCNNDGSEIPRAIINSTTTQAEIAMQPVLSANAVHNFSIYYNYSGATEPIYTRDSTITGNNYDGTYFYSTFTGGGINELRYLSGNDWNGGDGGLYTVRVSGDVYLDVGTGSCTLRVNKSVYTEWYCSNSGYSSVHGFFNNSPVRYIKINQLGSDANGAMNSYFKPNAEANGSARTFAYNTTYDTDGFVVSNPSRGIAGVWTQTGSLALLFLWNSSNITNASTNYNTVGPKWVGVGTHLGASPKFQNTTIWHAWVTGANDGNKIDNATAYWERYVNNPPTVAVSGSETFQILPFAISVASPASTTYFSNFIDLSATANEAVDKWWYSLDGGANTTFTPDTAFYASVGSRNLSVYANNTDGSIDSESISFAISDNLGTDWGNTVYEKCRTFTITENSGHSGTMNMRIMFTGLTIKSDGSDTRIVDSACNSGGTEVPRTVINSTTSAAEIAIQPVLTANTATSFSIYYNSSAASEPTYTRDSIVTSDTYDGTYFYSIFTAGGINELRYNGTANNNWNGGDGGLYTVRVSGDVYLDHTTGGCQLRVNRSVYTEWYCSNSGYSTVHGFFNDSPVRYIKINQPGSDANGAMNSYFKPNAEEADGNARTNVYNITYSTDGFNTISPSRGIAGVWTQTGDLALFFLWNSTDIMNGSSNYNTVGAKWVGVGTHLGASNKFQNTSVWHAWVTGASDAAKTDNATTYWHRYVNNTPTVSIGSEQNVSNGVAASLTIITPVNTTYATTSLNLNISSNRVTDKWWYRLNDGSNTSFTPQTVITVIEGNNTLIVYANISTGNISSANISFTKGNATDSNISYDSNGNREAGFGLYFEYNNFNQLVRVRNGTVGGTIIEEYTYDANGNRVMKYEPLRNSTTYYFDNNFVRVVNLSGTFDSVYYYDERSLVGSLDVNSSKISFYHPDHLGSTSITTNSTGNLIEETTYEPFGKIISGGNDRYDYTGKETDIGTGLDYYGARYYDPTYAQFTQPDIIIQDVYNPQTLNRYSYVLNNPMKYTDPTGNFWQFAALPALVSNPVGWVILGIMTVATVYSIISASTVSTAATVTGGKAIQSVIPTGGGTTISGGGGSTGNAPILTGGSDVNPPTMGGSGNLINDINNRIGDITQAAGDQWGKGTFKGSQENFKWHYDQYGKGIGEEKFSIGANSLKNRFEANPSSPNFDVKQVPLKGATSDKTVTQVVDKATGEFIRIFEGEILTYHP